MRWVGNTDAKFCECHSIKPITFPRYIIYLWIGLTYVRLSFNTNVPLNWATYAQVNITWHSQNTLCLGLPVWVSSTGCLWLGTLSAIMAICYNIQGMHTNTCRVHSMVYNIIVCPFNFNLAFTAIHVFALDLDGILWTKINTWQVI